MHAGQSLGSVEFSLAQGYTLLLITDGLTEAMNAAGEEFGVARVEAALRGLHVETPQACIKRLTDAVAVFVSKVEQSDDVTCLALLHKGTPA
jgi:sigma-B regulation protein RsbU (phosphoserine phosphatase)